MQPILIEKVNLHIVYVTLKAPFTTSFGTMKSREVCIVEVIDQSGLSGWGESVTANERIIMRKPPIPQYICWKSS